MASEKARLAKERGNAAFKAADYPAAIGHYTEAIIGDGSDHTFFLNRAAAYLKLGKSEDAERDCTKVLQLNPNNVKALFRRGQARRAVGNLSDAQADLDKALALEPSNESVKNEILEVEKLSRQRRPKYTVVDTQATTPARRRRVPIEIVECDTQPSDEKQTIDLLQPVSSRALKEENPVSQGPPSKPQTFKEAKQSKTARVSGGIFRHTGNHTIVSRPARDPNVSVPRPAPPTTLFQFTRSWQSLESDADRWALILTISPSTIPALFQVSLDPELLKSIIHTFQAVLEQDPAARDGVRNYLLAFSKVPRFGTMMLIMDKEERQLLELLHEKVNRSGSSEGDQVNK